MQRTTRLLYGYWNDVRGDRPAPRRFEIEPARMSVVLADTFLLERVADVFRFRLAGTRICHEFGAEFRGRNFLDLWQGDDRSTLQRNLDLVANRAAVLVIAFEAESTTGRAARFEALALPLCHDGEKITRILGSVSATDPPLWLGRERLVLCRLIRSTIVWPDGHPRQDARFEGIPKPVLSSMSGARLVSLEGRRFRVFEGGRGPEDTKKS